MDNCTYNSKKIGMYCYDISPFHVQKPQLVKAGVLQFITRRKLPVSRKSFYFTSAYFISQKKNN